MSLPGSCGSARTLGTVQAPTASPGIFSWLAPTPKAGVRKTVVRAPSMKDAGKAGFEHPLPITKVRLGPLIHKGNIETVKAFLKRYGLKKAEVKRSKVPLR